MSTESKPNLDEKIDCRVVAINYGADIQGAVIKATRRAVEQSTTRDRAGNVICRALLPIDEEKAILEAAKRPEAVAARHDIDRKRSEGWRKLSAQADAMNLQSAREAETFALHALLERLAPQQLPQPKAKAG